MDTTTPGVRLTKTGSFELTISHKLLPKGKVSRNFKTESDAADYKARMLTVLEMGVVPAELTRSGARLNPQTNPPRRKPTSAPVAASKKGTQAVPLSEMLGAYLGASNAKISTSDRPVVESLKAELQGNLDGVRTGWVDAWVRHMKRERKLAPGTVRKKVESLARAVDWWNRQEYQEGTAPPNVLRLLPKGYSAYQEEDLERGEEAKIDQERDRRLNPGEYDEIVAVLMGKHRDDKERPWARDDAQDFLMLFRLIVHTALRLREAYRMRVRDIKFELRTIHVPRSKTGAKRDVPMLRVVEGWLREYIKGKAPDDIVFPFWRGSDDEDVLKSTTDRLSRRFATLFAHCGCVDLTQHDLRHEATCRWVLLKDSQGRWMFRTEEVQRITGHKNAQQFLRYMSLRGSDLAERLE